MPGRSLPGIPQHRWKFDEREQNVERDWRIDQVNETPSELGSESSTPSRFPSGTCHRTRQVGLWPKFAASWVRVQAGRCLRFSAVCREEQIIHELGRVLEECESPERIEKSFIESVSRLTAARSVQWVLGPPNFPVMVMTTAVSEIRLARFGRLWTTGLTAFSRPGRHLVGRNYRTLKNAQHDGSLCFAPPQRAKCRANTARNWAIREDHGGSGVPVTRNGHHLGDLTEKTNTGKTPVFLDARFLACCPPLCAWALEASRRAHVFTVRGDRPPERNRRASGQSMGGSCGSQRRGAHCRDAPR